MPKKQSKEDKEYKEGVSRYKAWLKENKKFESSGLYGTDYYIQRVDKLEKQVKRLEAKLKANKVKQDTGWEE